MHILIGQTRLEIFSCKKDRVQLKSLETLPHDTMKMTSPRRKKSLDSEHHCLSESGLVYLNFFFATFNFE